MMKKLNRKGFTLIELLAVIVILAILMTLAITAMSGYITNAKKDTFVTTAQSYAGAARLNFINGSYNATIARGDCIAVKTSDIELESGSKDSTFGGGYDAPDDGITNYVIISNVALDGADNDKYEYYVQMVDAKGNGFGLMKESDLERSNVVLETVKTKSNPAGSYQSIPKELDDSSDVTINLYSQGDTEGSPSRTCKLVGIY